MSDEVTPVVTPDVNEGGQTVPVSTLIAERNKANARIQELESKITDFSTKFQEIENAKLSDTERLTKENADLKAAADAARKEAQLATRESWVRDALTREGAVKTSAAAKLFAAEHDLLTVIKSEADVPDLVKAFKESESYLFAGKQNDDVDNWTGRLGAGGNGKPDEKEERLSTGDADKDAFERGLLGQLGL